MYLLICLALCLSTYVAQNKQIESSLKQGYFTVTGIVGVLVLIFNII